MKDGYLDFDEYIRQGEPAQRERAEAWSVAIGLQAVDGLKTSDYLQNTARRNIEGEITIDEARELVKQYYITKTSHDNDDADKEEADRVSSNISKLLQTDAFTYSVAGLATIHRAIFEGVFKHAGHFREDSFRGIRNIIRHRNNSGDFLRNIIAELRDHHSAFVSECLSQALIPHGLFRSRMPGNRRIVYITVFRIMQVEAGVSEIRAGFFDIDERGTDIRTFGEGSGAGDRIHVDHVDDAALGHQVAAPRDQAEHRAVCLGRKSRGHDDTELLIRRKHRCFVITGRVGNGQNFFAVQCLHHGSAGASAGSDKA